MRSNTSYCRKPEWLKIKLPDAAKASQVVGLLKGKCLNTICQSGLCPNRGECWDKGTATFMIGGDMCTRACRFCNVKTGNPGGKIDAGEIERIIETISTLGLKHAVITSVDRDDLPDGGAAHWVALIRAIRKKCPSVTMETLVPDFRGNRKSLELIADEKPEVISHNLETVERLTPDARCTATYRGSLSVLEYFASRGIRTKSGIMLGLGEKEEEILQTMDDLRSVGCSVMTIGQYLQPTSNHYPVKAYIHPDKFEEYRLIGLEKGFLFVESSPFVRSSYHAERHAGAV